MSIRHVIFILIATSVKKKKIRLQRLVNIFFQPTKKMESIETEIAEDNNQYLLIFSNDDDEEKIRDELDDFIDNSFQPDGAYVFTDN